MNTTPSSIEKQKADTTPKHLVMSAKSFTTTPYIDFEILGVQVRAEFGWDFDGDPKMEQAYVDDLLVWNEKLNGYEPTKDTLMLSIWEAREFQSHIIELFKETSEDAIVDQQLRNLPDAA